MKIEIEGMKIEISDKTLAEEGIKPGELYVGKRNQGWKLGTFRNRHPDWGYIYAEEITVYPYNANECRKVIG